MASDSRRRSKQFQGSDILMMQAASLDLKQEESRNPLKNRKLSDIKENGATATPSMDEGEIGHSSKKKAPAKGFGKAAKMTQLIMISELFHIVTGGEGKRGSGLKGESLHDLVDMAGSQLPDPIKLKVRNYSQTQKIVHAKDFARWLQSEKIGNTALRSILEHCRAVGSPKTLRSKLQEFPALHWENRDGAPMKDTPSSRAYNKNEGKEEEKTSDDGTNSAHPGVPIETVRINKYINSGAHPTKSHRGELQVHQPRRASHFRSDTNAIIAASEITGAAALASAEAAAAMNAMGNLGEAGSDKKFIEIRKAMNDAAKKMVEAMTAAQQMQIERNAAKHQNTTDGKENNNCDENNNDDDNTGSGDGAVEQQPSASSNKAAAAHAVQTKEDQEGKVKALAHENDNNDEIHKSGIEKEEEEESNAVIIEDGGGGGGGGKEENFEEKGGLGKSPEEGIGTQKRLHKVKKQPLELSL
mmetsp:Transcript_28486/g.39758  ORF Transcript_28486/g.39758 Transcript_28486/m.39758 type:complete len:471 (+) Transcript_28486:483-1895(+)|eukprot:CAMPEP_0185253152 /NCGR_PEP_ID=MMETSP1359-20130426/2018_1 /TAXON_ID=552665 /ORGANISM="Bigelowiella longifila, Strain CCMP242" /LENGTH=470 /DNA_ID=CAMNT_0027835485 /DNA_START=136 /DNA_END=1548 /DNA_ORIENTATION=-